MLNPPKAPDLPYTLLPGLACQESARVLQNFPDHSLLQPGWPCLCPRFIIHQGITKNTPEESQITFSSYPHSSSTVAQVRSYLQFNSEGLSNLPKVTQWERDKNLWLLPSSLAGAQILFVERVKSVCSFRWPVGSSVCWGRGLCVQEGSCSPS